MFKDFIPVYDLIVIDSITHVIPEEADERDTNQPTMGLQARINNLICLKIDKAIAERKTTMVFINQLREKIGVMYGNPETTPGGRALKHMYNTRIEFRKGKPIEVGTNENKERIGNEIVMKCVKNKKGIPYRQSVVDFYTNGVIDNKKSLFYAALKYNVILLDGKTYSYNDTKIVGKENFLEELPEKEWDKVEKELWKVIK
jgi:recombination protein RecA